MSFTPAKSGQRLPQLRARQPQVYGHGPLALDLHDRADLPIRAAGQVQEQQGARTVLVVGQDNKVVLRPVMLGERVGDFYIATAGVEPGERVIVEGVQRARPGIQVKPVPKLAANVGG